MVLKNKILCEVLGAAIIVTFFSGNVASHTHPLHKAIPGNALNGDLISDSQMASYPDNQRNNYSNNLTSGNGMLVGDVPTVTLDAFGDMCIDDAPMTLSGGAPVGGTYSGTGVSAGIFDPGTAGAGTHTITYEYTDPEGYTNSASETITVHPEPTVSSPGDLEYCDYEMIPEILLTRSSDGVVFDILGGEPIGLNDMAGATKIPSFRAEAGTATITLIPKAYDCIGTPVYFNITVNRPPDIGVNLSSPVICSGESSGITLSSSTSGTVFSWTVPGIAPTGSITGFSEGNDGGFGTGYMIDQLLENNTTSPATITYLIHAKANGCAASQLVSLTVNPVVSAIIEGPPPVCQNETEPEIIFTATGGAAPYTFYYNINGGATRQTVINSGNQAVVNVPTSVSGTFTYNLLRVRGSTSCTYPQAGSVSVTIYSQPTLNSDLNPPGICSDTEFSYTAIPVIPGTTISWIRAAIPELLNPASSGTVDINETLQLHPSVSDPTLVTYTYTLVSPEGCEYTEDVSVMVTPTPLSLTSASEQGTICSGDLLAYTPASNVTSGVEFQWSRPAMGGNPANSGIGPINESLINNTGSTITVTYEFYLSTDNCSSGPFEVNVNVKPSVEASAWASRDIICPGEKIDLFSDIPGSASISWTSDPPGYTSSDKSPKNVYPTETTTYIATYTDPATGCLSNASTTVTVSQPDATIMADFCTTPGKIILSTGSFETYNWQPLPAGQTNGQAIEVDLVGIYTVTVTDVNGCTGTASINVSNELVTNGDFSNGRDGFISDYEYTTNSGGLATGGSGGGEGRYAIGTNANFYHSNFWGHDHTTGAGNFMIVNGRGSELVVWEHEQPINLMPGTEYYFSAWGLSLNNVSPYANLSFEIEYDGITEQIGNNAQLPAGQNILNNPWRSDGRFYGTWTYPGSTPTTAIIRIINLRDELGGNDFGIDDISFGTLAPSPATISETSDIEVCVGETIHLQANVIPGKPPYFFNWTGPGGFSSSLENPEIANATTANGGIYTLKITDFYGCEIPESSMEVFVREPATVDAGEPQSVCSAFPVELEGSMDASATNPHWTGGSGTFDPDRNSLTPTYTPGNDEITAGTVTLTLHADEESGTCPSSDDVTITILQSPEVEITFEMPQCYASNNGTATATVTGGLPPYSYLWDDTLAQTTATAEGLPAGDYTVVVTDNNGCAVPQTVEVTEPPQGTFYNVTAIDPTCFQGDDGQATINADGGTTPYIYEWSANTGSQTTQTAENLSSGYYTFTVYDGNNCWIKSGSVRLYDPAAPQFNCTQFTDIAVDASPGATNAAVALPDPIFDTDCQTISWTMSGATIVSTPVSGIIPSPYTFNTGTTTVEYAAESQAGEILTCSFKVIVNAEPIIRCAVNITLDADDDACSTSYNPGTPSLEGGVLPVEWSWAITGPDGTTQASGTSTGNAPDPAPLPIGTHNFKTGTSTITWRAENSTYGFDECTQEITVTDHFAPGFTVPAPLEVCVDNIITATYYAPGVDIHPEERPEYYTFSSGNEALDLDPANYTDNCDLSCAVEIRWRIDFADGTMLPLSPIPYFTGQPSAYGSDILFQGDDPPYDDDLIHTITYWIVDCHNNVSAPHTTTITIKPRPNIIKQN